MSLWRQLTHGLRSLLNQTAADKDAGDEVQQYFEEAARAFMSRGYSPEDAQRAARLELGNITLVKEQVRTYGWENALRTFAADLNYGTRQLRAHAGFAIVGILTLALGIGAPARLFLAR